MSERFVGTVRKCDTGNQWCERDGYVCPYACERAVREKADRVIADASGLLAGLPHYAQHKWGMAESSTGLYVKAADVKAALDTEQSLHTAWRKRAEEAEARLAEYNTGKFCDADALAAAFITLKADLAAAQAENRQLTGHACLICGRESPCADAPDACTFDPHPIEAARRFMDQRDEARAEAAALRADAERYRWLRADTYEAYWAYQDAKCLSDEFFDAAIDQARGGGK